jgi:hypothetical protein
VTSRRRIVGPLFFEEIADSKLRLGSTHSSLKPQFSGFVSTVLSESRCALMLRYVDLVVSIEVAVKVCCCSTVFRY